MNPEILSSNSVSEGDALPLPLNKWNLERGDSEMLTHHNLNSILGPTWCKQRTNSSKLSSDLCMHKVEHICAYTVIKKLKPRKFNKLSKVTYIFSKKSKKELRAEALLTSLSSTMFSAVVQLNYMALRGK